jgi:hypothetical protein
VGSKGHPYAHFRRALERRHLLNAEVIARELPSLSLADALALTLLMAEQAPDRFPRAAARWHARFVLEAPRMSFGDSLFALAAVGALPDPTAAKALAELARAHGLTDVGFVLHQRP